jgi:hypothetical protein
MFCTANGIRKAGRTPVEVKGYLRLRSISCKVSESIPIARDNNEINVSIPRG